MRTAVGHGYAVFPRLARSPERPLDPSPRTFVNNHIHSPVHSLIYTADSYRAAQGVEEERAAFKYHNSIWLQFDNDV